MATRSDSDSASSWSCVTLTKVRPTRPVQRLQLLLQFAAQLLVERRERLVSSSSAGSKTSARASATAAAARPRAGAAAGPRSAELHEVERRPHLRLPLRGAELPDAQREGDVLATVMCGNSA
jgi:hypothetical protein